MSAIYKPGDRYPAMNVLRVYADRAEVFYSCCGRTVMSRHETVERHIRLGRDKCAQCAAAAKRKGETVQRVDTDRDQPGAVLRGIVKAGSHYWWPMSGVMGR